MFGIIAVVCLVAAADDTHWSFRPVARPTPPVVRDATWPRDDLDRFILAKLDAAGMSPNPDADRRTLIRRAAFDLTGLPPTVEESDAFVADPAPDDAALAKVVDAYLKSPRFGERWGRHWLDVARYADSVGRSWNAPFLYAWRYRDYVIDSFNADMPFDAFIREEIAGDLLPARSEAEQRERMIATGFLTLGSVNLQEGTAGQLVFDRIDDQIDATTRAFLGLTVACARCHDHKTDPIGTRDYYALAGVFASTRTFAGQGTRVAIDDSKDYVDADLLVRLPGAKPAGGEGVRSMTEYTAALRAGPKNAVVRYTNDPDRAMGVTEGRVADCAIRVKGDPYETGPTPARGDVRIPGLPTFPKVPAGASGRLQLAEWVASTDNPLTARVWVNRVWLHLFGRGIVATPDDFGTTGDEPTHPQVLDHLVGRFVAGGWSVKALIRSVVLSRTYRLSSAGRADAKEKDPANALYWRANLRRLEVEPLRDSLLAAAGKLSFARPSGIPVAGTGGKGRGAVTHAVYGVESPYRTVYLPVLRSLTPEVYGTFDFPDPCQVAGRREVTTVSPQALFFLNSGFVAECARGAAEVAANGPKDNRVRLMYQRLLGRPPTADELTDATGSVADLGWAALAQGLMASAEFRYVR